MKRDREESDDFIPLSRIKIETTTNGRINENADLTIDGVVQSKYSFRVWVLSKFNLIAFDNDNLHMKIGRHRSCDIQTNYKNVSKQHCYFVMKENGLYVVDLDSSNGTCVNGHRIKANVHTLLCHGDVIILAEHKLATFEVAYFPPTTNWWRSFHK